jgi:hypothetical protein
MKLLVMQIPPISRHFISLRSKYSPQHLYSCMLHKSNFCYYTCTEDTDHCCSSNTEIVSSNSARGMGVCQHVLSCVGRVLANELMQPSKETYQISKRLAIPN